MTSGKTKNKVGRLSEDTQKRGENMQTLTGTGEAHSGR